MSDNPDPTPLPPSSEAPEQRWPEQVVSYLRKEGDTWVAYEYFPPPLTELLNDLGSGGTVTLKSSDGSSEEWTRSTDSMSLLFNLTDTVNSSDLSTVADPALLTSLVLLLDHIDDIRSQFNRV
jgi:hypothetical protein